MKFRFNGDTDCPDWILAEIYTLSRLSSVKLKLLGQVVVQGIIMPPIQTEKIDKLFADSKLDADIDLKSCIACLKYIISSATRFHCESSALQSELQQLGLPREHSNSIKRVFEEYNGALSENFKAQLLRVNPLEGVSATSDPETGCAILNLNIGGKQEFVTVTPKLVDNLLIDLTHIKKKMSELKESM
ncbi:unnamed protein product [Ceutorhynchus assimilis]|uniref:COMM domain-containing protein 4 n=1 Tax=Ceutorhynchus assimilis TaxID=467358 RepID=A0A9P0DJ92_9CUCU|nr:unnamed protein product [Ceutorhynchus assimilis]